MVDRPLILFPFPEDADKATRGGGTSKFSKPTITRQFERLEPKFTQLSSTYHIFMPGLGGGKMSASEPNSYIALTDSAEEVKRKINKYAFSGGQATLEEHRKKGGNPDVDVCFQYLKMFFEPNDKKLTKIYEDYKSGKLTTGDLKKYTIGKINDFLKGHKKKFIKAQKDVKKRFGK